MVDFHTHILPCIDDGAESTEMSLAMLRESRAQGISTVFATPHFYADETDPDTFLRERDRAYLRLLNAMEQQPDEYPEIQLGAELLFFPGMSGAAELSRLKMGNTKSILIEPPMCPWTEAMLNEIEQTGANLKCVPVIAHIDRYMRYLKDNTLFDRVRGRRILVQVNAGFFINRKTRAAALRLLSEDRIHFIGSDCHDNENRPQNIGRAKEVIESFGLGGELNRLDKRVRFFIGEADE